MKQKRKWEIELLRAIACLSVVFFHCAFNMTNSNGELVLSKVFFRSMSQDGVCIFFMITGFFLFKHFNYKRRLKDLITKILFPALCLYILMFYFYDFLTGAKSISECFSKNAVDYYSFIQTFFTQHQPSIFAHYWYISIYIYIIIISPLLYWIYRKIISKKYLTVIYTIIYISIMIINDLSAGGVFGPILTLNTLIRSSLTVLFAAVTFETLNKFKNKFWLILCPILIITINMLRTICYLTILSGHNQIMLWSSIFGISNSLLTVIFCHVLGLHVTNKNVKLISIKVGEQTYLIYIIHVFIKSFLEGTWINNYLLNLLPNSSAIFTLSYDLILTVLTFTISLVISLIAKLIYSKLKKITIQIWRKIN